MKRYYKKFEEEIIRSDNFDSNENLYFPEGYRENEKVISEYMRLCSYYYDKSINEVSFLSNEREKIENILVKIRNFIDQESYEEAQLYIVALQILLDIEIKFKKVLKYMILEDIDINKLINKFYTEYNYDLTEENKKGFLR